MLRQCRIKMPAVNTSACPDLRAINPNLIQMHHVQYDSISQGSAHKARSSAPSDHGDILIDGTPYCAAHLRRVLRN